MQERSLRGCPSLEIAHSAGRALWELLSDMAVWVPTEMFFCALAVDVVFDSDGSDVRMDGGGILETGLAGPCLGTTLNTPTL